MGRGQSKYTTYRANSNPHAAFLRAEKQIIVAWSLVHLLKGDLCRNFRKLCTNVRVVDVSAGVDSRKDMQRLVLTVFLDEPSRRFWHEPHGHMQCYRSLCRVRTLSAYAFSESGGCCAYQHLQSHWKPPRCVALDVAGAVLDPKGDQDTEVYETLKYAYDATADPTCVSVSTVWMNRHVFSLSRCNFALIHGDLNAVRRTWQVFAGLAGLGCSHIPSWSSTRFQGR